MIFLLDGVCQYVFCVSYMTQRVTELVNMNHDFFFFCCSCFGRVPLLILFYSLPRCTAFLLLTSRTVSTLSAVRRIFKLEGESLENSVFLHYRLLGWCLFKVNWTGVIWEMFREKCSLICSNGLHGGPGGWIACPDFKKTSSSDFFE